MPMNMDSPLIISHLLYDACEIFPRYVNRGIHQFWVVTQQTCTGEIIDDLAMICYDK